MKYCFIFILFITVDTTAQKYNPNIVYKTTTSLNGLKSSVKKVTTKVYTYFENDTALALWRRFVKDSVSDRVFLTKTKEILFDTAGFKFEETVQQSFYKRKIVNNEDPESINFIEIFGHNFTVTDEKWKLYQLHSSKHVYVYDKQKRLVSIKQSGGDTVTGFSCDFVYDDRGNLASSKFWGNKNSLIDEYVNEYDKNDSLVQVQRYNYTDKSFNIEKLKYHPKSNSWEVFIYLLNNKLYKKILYQKSDTSFYSKITFTKNSWYKKSSLEKLDDNNGNLLYLKIIDKNGNLVKSVENIRKKISEKGKILEMDIVDNIANKTLNIKYEYKFDSFGNEVERREFNADGKLIQVVLISYED